MEYHPKKELTEYMTNVMETKYERTS